MASPQQASSKVTLSTHLLTRNHTAFYSQRTTSRTTRRNKSGAQKRDRPCSNTIRPAPGLSPDPQHQGTGGPESCRHLGTARATGQDLKEKTNANTPNHRPLEKVTGKEGQPAPPTCGPSNSRLPSTHGCRQKAPQEPVRVTSAPRALTGVGSYPPPPANPQAPEGIHTETPPLPSTGPGEGRSAVSGHRQDRTRNFNSMKRRSFLCYLLTCLRSKFGCLRRNTRAFGSPVLMPDPQLHVPRAQPTLSPRPVS